MSAARLLALMGFGAPLGLLALLAVPALVGLYFLRRRQPPRVVSTLFLWSSPDQRAEAGPRDVALDEEIAVNLEADARWELEVPQSKLPLRGQPIDRRGSDLRDRASTRVASPLPVGRVLAEKPRSFVALLLFALFLCLDWVVTSRAAGSRVRASAT